MSKTLNYQEQAESFLQTYNIKLSIKYLKHDYHFQDDTDKRDIYKIRLSRNRHSYTINFGQSIANQGQEPTAYDVLACLNKYNPNSFTDFCSDFGYDTDSRQAERTYKAVCREWAGIQRVFGNDSEYNPIMKEFREIN